MSDKMEGAARRRAMALRAAGRAPEIVAIPSGDFGWKLWYDGEAAFLVTPNNDGGRACVLVECSDLDAPGAYDYRDYDMGVVRQWGRFKDLGWAVSACEDHLRAANQEDSHVGYGDPPFDTAKGMLPLPGSPGCPPRAVYPIRYRAASKHAEAAKASAGGGAKAFCVAVLKAVEAAQLQLQVLGTGVSEIDDTRIELEKKAEELSEGLTELACEAATSESEGADLQVALSKIAVTVNEYQILNKL